ncbi:hypothetical protein [Paenibacillus mucilaginosus]|uniref:Uncharacterized protein n=3 Tax=Paenibacillus mucilaginosus TaxID=61624 RepID=H6NBM2_9BACL|nr:hypothetical protein [Paenibacillus mucilaginosus]AEI46173.1 hypothetical protein KNP414_07687 [Paenibacillus mucilaginosus KNP414]AFC33791.1 hypothetical protein PM3016_7215 [Paenibacillus mucilaginosus 3016]AFH66121.1 hypothetical protein B2K_36400 [Paenibacillus mucilaginosus K02]MCG7213695.1 hypothetical protein [Paenibacillus mucilaginosus]WDM27501.1 hypothetical protein KCX80_35015 [Paenibacillus mucilaginosus]
MKFSISYKGKLLGHPMSREQAEAALQKLSLCMNNLQIVQVTSEAPAAVEPRQRIIV